MPITPWPFLADIDRDWLLYDFGDDQAAVDLDDLRTNLLP